jgi:putative hemolysin
MFTVDQVIDTHYPKLTEHPFLYRSSHFLLRHLLHEKDITEFGESYSHVQGLDFVEQVLEYFNISYSVRDNEKECIPNLGKLVIIANHPIGSLDALALIKLISEVRSDVKVVANQMLMTLEPLRDMLLPVNNMQGGTPKQHLANIQAHLSDEGAVLIFPAGEVSRLRPQGIRDTHWHTGFLRIAKTAQAPILPVFIDAKNSPVFYGVSMLYKPLATALLVQEMFKQKQNHLPIRLGEVIPHSSYANLPLNLPEAAKLFKQHLYRIGKNKKPLFATQKPIALPEDRTLLTKAIHQQCELLGKTHDEKSIYLYEHKGYSPIMREIGRLREVSFRAVGEGTNKRRDIDQYDHHYYHLILWDEQDLEIVGAYRFGDAKKLSVADHPCGMYSATLFDFEGASDALFEKGLELGRSFVQPRYWGKRSLDYLWFGIGAFLNRYPRYQYVFGPVSISNALPSEAISLIVEFYSTQFDGIDSIRGLSASAKTPLPSPDAHTSRFHEVEYKQAFKDLKHLLANMGASVPTLYKQYSEFCESKGVGFLAFNIDPDFNDCIDGLAVADLNYVRPKKRERYLTNNSFGRQTEDSKAN